MGNSPICIFRRLENSNQSRTVSTRLHTFANSKLFKVQIIIRLKLHKYLSLSLRVSIFVMILIKPGFSVNFWGSTEMWDNSQLVYAADPWDESRPVT